ncbi:MAG: hypothetical protein KJ572_03920 [Gammaproteobacteria bacterium]|nr:hypothetical protein [Sideroxydans sp.]MBU4045468.1 hypothetical protein [Gammaproteobacteria bacterium]
MNESELHPSIVALVSLAADIASNHPKQGLCKIDRLKQYGVPRQHIETVIEIARHIRDEAAQKLDASFDLALTERLGDTTPAKALPEQAACCSPTASGQSCC